MKQKIYRDIPLETPVQIQTAIEQLYRTQTELPLPAKINGVEDLCQLIDKSTNETIRWRAIEYLWIIAPDHPKLPLRLIRDLGIKFATGSLALTISELPMSGSRHAILLRDLFTTRSKTINFR
jgi:HEAT repeat protein